MKNQKMRTISSDSTAPLSHLKGKFKENVLLMFEDFANNRFNWILCNELHNTIIDCYNMNIDRITPLIKSLCSNGKSISSIFINNPNSAESLEIQQYCHMYFKTAFNSSYDIDKKLILSSIEKLIDDNLDRIFDYSYDELPILDGCDNLDIDDIEELLDLTDVIKDSTLGASYKDDRLIKVLSFILHVDINQSVQDAVYSDVFSCVIKSEHIHGDTLLISFILYCEYKYNKDILNKIPVNDILTPLNFIKIFIHSSLSTVIQSVYYFPRIEYNKTSDIVGCSIFNSMIGLMLSLLKLKSSTPFLNKIDQDTQHRIILGSMSHAQTPIYGSYEFHDGSPSYIITFMNLLAYMAKPNKLYLNMDSDSPKNNDDILAYVPSNYTMCDTMTNVVMYININHILCNNIIHAAQIKSMYDRLYKDYQYNTYSIPQHSRIENGTDMSYYEYVIRNFYITLNIPNLERLIGFTNIFRIILKTCDYTRITCTNLETFQYLSRNKFSCYKDGSMLTTFAPSMHNIGYYCHNLLSLLENINNPDAIKIITDLAFDALDSKNKAGFERLVSANPFKIIDTYTMSKNSDAFISYMKFRYLD